MKKKRWIWATDKNWTGVTAWMPLPKAYMR